MLTYVLATAFACLLAWLGERSGGRKWPWYLAAAIPLSAVAAARWGLGTDVDFLYLPQFTAVQWHFGGEGEPLAVRLFQPLKEGLLRRPIGEPLAAAKLFWNHFNLEECGYRWLTEAIVLCGGSFRWFVAITAILVGGLVFTAIARQSRFPALAVYFFVTTSNYFVSLNVVRQYIAVGFVLVAVEFAVDRRVWRFAACILAAALFHRSAVLAGVIWFLPVLRFGPSTCFVVVAATLGGSVLVAPAFRLVLPWLGMGIYAKYFNGSFARDGFEWLFFLINLCFLSLGAWYFRRATNASRYARIWYYMTVIGTMALSLSAVVPLMKRINYYFAAPQFLLLPELVTLESRPAVRRTLVILSILAFAAETAVAVLLMNKNEPLPSRMFP